MLQKSENFSQGKRQKSSLGRWRLSGKIQRKSIRKLIEGRDWARAVSRLKILQKSSGRSVRKKDFLNPRKRFNSVKLLKSNWERIVGPVSDGDFNRFSSPGRWGGDFRVPTPQDSRRKSWKIFFSPLSFTLSRHLAKIIFPQTSTPVVL